MQEVQPAAVRVAVPPPLLEKLRILPERVAKAQHDLENVPGLDPGKRPLLGRKCRLEPERAGLQDGGRQGDHDRARVYGGFAGAAVAATTDDRDLAALPANGVGNCAQPHFGALGVQPVAEPLHQRVTTVEDAELRLVALACARFATAIAGRFFTERFGAQSLGARGVKAFYESPEQLAAQRRQPGRFEVLAHRKVLAPFCDQPRELLVHALHIAPGVPQLAEVSRRRELASRRQLDHRQTRRLCDR